MQAFDNSKQSTGRTTQSCGYCRTTGHSIKDCPYIKYDHDEWKAFRVPHTSPTLNAPIGRWIMRDYSYWVKQIDKYYPKWERWQQPRTSGGRAVSASPVDADSVEGRVIPVGIVPKWLKSTKICCKPIATIDSLCTIPL